MAEDLMTTLDERAEAMASRLGAEGLSDARRRISRRRWARAAIASLVVLPVVGLGVWAASSPWGATEVEPAHSMPIRLDQPLEPQVLAAIAEGDAAAVEELLQLGADPWYMDEASEGAEVPATLAYRAMIRCDTETLGVLDRFGAPRVTLWPPDEDLAVLAAMMFCDPVTVDAVLDGSPMVGEPDRVMEMAVQHGSIPVINALLVAGYPTELDGSWSALETAVTSDRHDPDDVVALLLDMGADPTVEVDGEPIVDRLSRRPGVPIFVWETIQHAAAAAAEVEGS